MILSLVLFLFLSSIYIFFSFSQTFCLASSTSGSVTSRCAGTLKVLDSLVLIEILATNKLICALNKDNHNNLQNPNEYRAILF